MATAFGLGAEIQSPTGLLLLNLGEDVLVGDVAVVNSQRGRQ